MAQREVKWPFLRVSTELSQNTEFLECPSGPQPNCGRAKQSNFLISLPLLIIINTTLQTPFEVRVHCSLAKEAEGNPPYFFTTCARFSLKPIRKRGMQNNNREILFASGRADHTWHSCSSVHWGLLLCSLSFAWGTAESHAVWDLPLEEFCLYCACVQMTRSSQNNWANLRIVFKSLFMLGAYKSDRKPKMMTEQIKCQAEG